VRRTRNPTLRASSRNSDRKAVSAIRLAGAAKGGLTLHRSSGRPRSAARSGDRSPMDLGRVRNGVQCPLLHLAGGPTIAIMTTTSSTLPSVALFQFESDAPRAAGAPSEGGSLGCLARCLAEVAHALRVEADRSEAPADLAGVFAEIESALGDLAAAVEHSAHAVIDNDRPPGARASQPPTAAARAVSWRLHGLAHALRASREICPAIQGASRELTRAQQAHRGSALTGMHLHRQLLGPST
jgi:hypothetical protein